MARKNTGIKVNSRAVPFIFDENSTHFFDVEYTQGEYIVSCKKGLRVFGLVSDHIAVYKKNVGFAYFSFIADNENHSVNVSYVLEHFLPDLSAKKAKSIRDAVFLIEYEEFS